MLVFCIPSYLNFGLFQSQSETSIVFSVSCKFSYGMKNEIKYLKNDLTNLNKRNPIFVAYFQRTASYTLQFFMLFLKIIDLKKK